MNFLLKVQVVVKYLLDIHHKLILLNVQIMVIQLLQLVVKKVYLYGNFWDIQEKMKD